MGVKEEKLSIRVLVGYADKIRPHHVVGGLCFICGEEVWLDPPPRLPTFESKYVHYSCQPA